MSTVLIVFNYMWKVSNTKGQILLHTILQPFLAADNSCTNKFNGIARLTLHQTKLHYDFWMLVLSNDFRKPFPINKSLAVNFLPYKPFISLGVCYLNKKLTRGMKE